MVEYYFNIETTGLNPLDDKIITIQIQKLVGRTGEAFGKLKIFKEWESSEKEIIKKIMPKLTSSNPFDFIIVGKDLLFDFMFLGKRAEKYELGQLDLISLNKRVFTDIKHVLVLINKGNFRGYNKLLTKGRTKGAKIPLLYEQKKYDEIIRHLEIKTQTFIDAYKMLRTRMPSLASYF